MTHSFKNIHFDLHSPLTWVVAIALLTALGSSFLGFKLGEESLKGVSQPEVNPSQKLLDKPVKKKEGLATSQRMVTFKPINENQIIKQVKTTMGIKEQENKNAKNAKKQGKKEASKSQKKQTKPASTKTNN
ncbi:MAG: hypothetical protein VKJ02_08720 [Snowella sp.]|nr:hypothetical protein [Snowella sp.]